MAYKILIVDDEQDIRKLIAKVLENRDFEVKTAADGIDALDMIALERFDLYILDVFMPNMSGLELMKKIKELDSLAVIIITTAFSSIEIAMKAVRGGAFHYLTKPIVPEELFRVVDTGIRQHEDMMKNILKSAPSLGDEIGNMIETQMLRGFSYEDKSEFQDIGESCSYSPGTEISMADDPGSIVLIESGNVSVWIGETQVEQIHEGESWGEESFVSPNYVFTTLKAETETRIKHFSRKKIIDFLTYKDESLTKRFTINLMTILYSKWKKAILKVGSFIGYENNVNEV